jgi:hypothetical protein
LRRRSATSSAARAREDVVDRGDDEKKPDPGGVVGEDVEGDADNVTSL